MRSSAPLLGNVVIHVSDMDRALRFYTDGLGLGVRFDSGWEVRAAMNALSGSPENATMRIVAFELPQQGGLALCSFGSPTGRSGAFERAGAVHVGIRVDDVDIVLEAAVAQGGTPLGTPGIVGPPGRKSKLAFVTDPDGTVIELVHDVAAPAETAEEGPA